MMDQTLVEELRRHGLTHLGSPGWHAGLCDAAADALEAQGAEIEGLRTKLGNLDRWWKWDPEGDNHLESMAADMPVLIAAGALQEMDKQLNAARAAAKLCKSAMLDCMHNTEDALARGRLAIWGPQEAVEEDHAD